MLQKEIRYRYGNQWMFAKKEKGKFGILTEALDCTIRRNDKLSEGVVELTVCDSMEDEILEEAVTILTISLIQRSLTMCDKTMENYKPNMFQLQCLKALEIQIEGEKGYKFKKDQKIRIKSNFVKNDENLIQK